MAYHGLNEIKRDRYPYISASPWIRPTWAPEIYNTPFFNMQKTALVASLSSSVVETVRHFRTSFFTLNYVYEYPKNSLQWSIFMREMTKMPGFFGELRKKIVYGAVQHSLDAGFKVSMFSYIWGGTWSPKNFADFNTPKIIGTSFLAGFLTGWVNYPLETARRAYFADLTWPEELRKGYRSPLHALLKIPFSEGPLYLFRGGFLHYLGNSIGFGWLTFIYTYLKDKFFWVWKYNETNYSFVKFLILNTSFLLSAIGSQPFFAMKNIMDNIPKERGGQNSYNTSYDAWRYLKLNWDSLTANYVNGYYRWFRQYGAILYLTIWYADNLGMMDNYKVDPNRLETTIADFITD